MTFYLAVFTCMETVLGNVPSVSSSAFNFVEPVPPTMGFGWLWTDHRVVLFGKYL